MPTFDVNNDNVIELTAKLERLHKSSFPSAVRNTLNNAAFNMKKVGLIESARSNFTTVRSPTFFRRFTQVNKAEGFDVNSMSSVVGFSNTSNQQIKTVVDGMKKHEYGGVTSKGMRYLKSSRTGSNYAKRVQRKNYYRKNNIISGTSQRRGTRKSKFVGKMFKARAENKMMFMTSMKGNYLAKVQRVSKGRDGRIKSKLKIMMMSRDKTPVKISRNRFISKAAAKQAKALPKYFKNNAEFQFKKQLRR